MFLIITSREQDPSSVPLTRDDLANYYSFRTKLSSDRIDHIRLAFAVNLCEINSNGTSRRISPEEEITRSRDKCLLSDTRSRQHHVAPART